MDINQDRLQAAEMRFLKSMTDITTRNRIRIEMTIEKIRVCTL
jgi:hypothetical protein